MRDQHDTSSPSISFLFVILVGVFITCLITANIIAVKLIVVFSLVVPAAIIIFPISYIIGDVLTEVYGFRRVRKIIWLGFLCNLILVMAIWIGRILPPASFWEKQQAYEQILGFTPRLLFASFAAYLIGEFSNSVVLAKMKIATKGRWLWTRTIGSTLVGQGLDSAVFICLGFIDVIPLGALTTAIATQWLFKSIYEVLATPLTYWMVNFIKRKEGLDIYDYDTQFNPFMVSG